MGAPFRLTPRHRYELDVRGFLLLNDVLTADDVDALRGAIAAQNLPPPGPTVDQQRFGAKGTMLGWHQAFRDLIDHPVVVEVLRHLIGPYVRLDHAYGIIMRPGTAGLGLHGPMTPFDPSQFYLHRGGRMWNGLVTFGWSLTDARPGDGGFGCIPGSHRADEPLPPDAGELVVEVPQRAGSLVVFTEALVHCTVPWNGVGDRLSLLYKYSPGNSAWDPSQWVGAELSSLLTPRQRLLVESPYVGGRPAALPER